MNMMQSILFLTEKASFFDGKMNSLKEELAELRRKLEAAELTSKQSAELLSISMAAKLQQEDLLRKQILTPTKDEIVTKLFRDLAQIQNQTKSVEAEIAVSASERAYRLEEKKIIKGLVGRLLEASYTEDQEKVKKVLSDMEEIFSEWE